MIAPNGQREIPGATGDERVAWKRRWPTTILGVEVLG
jgi:hypothetical protein